MTRHQRSGNDPAPCWKPTPTPCSAVPPSRRRKSAAGSRPRTASARASATWRSAPSPAGNNASTPATAPTSAASPPAAGARSPWAPAACELAARYALACAERCDGDEPLERECAGACRRFVEACRPLLPAASGMLGPARMTCGVEWETDGHVDGSRSTQYQYHPTGAR
ncbi:four-helix bundle copper-binding protein [Pseudomonas aeruginosa]|uniref:four-helix bundle copper-binding protein n=1 Tax=Pseudomonas aeruginosa TaxID=287 RepID=UPI000A5A4E4C